jgi:hypothetical protein
MCEADDPVSQDTRTNGHPYRGVSCPVRDVVPPTPVDMSGHVRPVRLCPLHDPYNAIPNAYRLVFLQFFHGAIESLPLAVGLVRVPTPLK